MNRLIRWLDPLFGLTLAAALLGALVTAWPGVAQAADRALGNGEVASEQRLPGEFEAVLTENLRVRVRQGSNVAVVVQADSNLLALVETTVEDRPTGKTLVVRWSPRAMVSPRIEPVVTVTVARLTGLGVSGSGDITAEPLRTPRLSARIDGSGDIRLADLVADELQIAITGSGDVSAAGQVGRLDLRIAGSGDVKASALQADVVSVSIAGSGDARIQAHRTLEVSIAGSGDVVYSGNATVKQRIAGSGTLTRR